MALGTTRYVIIFFLLISLLVSDSAQAAWSPNGVTVKSTNATIPLVEACSDGSDGTFVVWQEEATAGQGVLLAQHLLASGDLDPAWPAGGALVSGAVTTRKSGGALPDRLGGLYVWWRVGNSLVVNRLDSNGQVATGWPANGRGLGSILPLSPLPSVIEDGASGFYAAWSRQGADPDQVTVAAIHLGPNNTGAGGWPNSTRSLAPPTEVYTLDLWPRLALAPDGGVFGAWASWSEDTISVPSAFRMRRLDPAGLDSPGWPAEGREFGAFRLESFDPSLPPWGLLGLCNDGRGGVFLLTGSPIGREFSYLYVENRLYRRQADGETADDWPDAGRVPASLPTALESTQTFERFDYSAVWDGLDGVFVGAGEVGVENHVAFTYRRYLASGSPGPGDDLSGGPAGFTLVPKGDGGAFMGTFSPDGPLHPYDPYAILSVTQSLPPPGWSNFNEVHTEIGQHWFGDVALAYMGPGLPDALHPDGVVFFWSQANQRYGLFARAFTSTGQVTAVPETRSPLALSRVWFDAHAGIRASAFLPSGGAVRFEVFDITGRRVATERAASSGATEITAHGTVALPSGLYFARISDSGASASARVVVTH